MMLCTRILPAVVVCYTLRAMETSELLN